MNATYARILAARSDMTEWLVHFTRISGNKMALEVLRNILVEGALRPGFSVRTTGRTVYGPNRAVCFSEQPISAVEKYVIARNDRYSVDAFGLLIHKHDAFSAGALPVIYGLSNSYEVQDPTIHNFPKETRLLDPSCLPVNEQYRFIRLHANGSPGDADWTHEREWRWPENAVQHVKATGLFLLGDRENFGKGAFQGRVHVFVSDDRTLAWLRKELTEARINKQTGVFAELAISEPRFAHDYPSIWSQALESVKVITLDQVQKLGITRFEDFPEQQKTPLLM
jgi:hypothetical protein